MKRINYYFAAPQFLMLPEMLLAEENVRVRRWLVALSILAFAAETAVEAEITEEKKGKSIFIVSDFYCSSKEIKYWQDAPLPAGLE